MTALRMECLLRGIWRSHDDRVRIDGAAELLGLSTKTLRNWRSNGDPRLPPFEVRSGRPLFALSGIAAQLEARK